MDEERMIKLASMLATIAYEIHDHKGISEELREMFLDLWREFDHYNYIK